VPRRNRRWRPRARAAQVAQAERQPTPPQLAQRLVSRGLAPLVILEVSEAYVPLAVAVCSDRALIGPEAARLLLRLIAATERLGHRDGIALSPQLAGLRDVFRVVAASAGGHEDVRATADLTPWESEEIALGGAARLLGRSTRQTRRLAASGVLGPTRRVGQSWLVSKTEVLAYAAHREAET